MSNQPAPYRATTPALDRARRVLRQQLDALSRLAVVAWRLVDPATPSNEPAASVSVGILRLENALRLQARVAWAVRLIAALRAKLLGDLRGLESGRLPALAIETPDVAATPERSMAEGARAAADRVERPERRERREGPERFGFESRRSDDDLAEILQRPTAEIIALICRELGLPADWPRQAEEAWAREQTDDDGAEPRGSPPGLPRSLPEIPAAPS
ncbi:MAG: hypothetical protein J0I28_05475 [Caulobacterales bacterium]|nr:hypothetical protein [Caulobacterales bacterium]